MKKHVIFTLLSLVLVGGSCSTTTPQDTTATSLTIYAYDSLIAEYGLLPKIIDQFEQDNSVTVELISFPDTGSMLNQLLTEQAQPQTDVVMGLDNTNLPTVIANNLLSPYTPQRANDIPADLRFDDAFTMTPFDYGYVGFVYDSEAIQFTEPISLADLATPEYRDKIILEQPGLSSPGTQLLLWTNVALDDTKADTFWRSMADTVLTVAPDWGTAYYTMFLSGEAPIVLSYLTSPAYHIDQEGTHRYQAIPIKEGYVRQLEGIGVSTGNDATELAQAFVDYVLTDTVQNAIPTTQWMFPIFGQSEQWPAAYQQIITPTEDQVLPITPESIDQLEQWIKEWNSTFGV